MKAYTFIAAEKPAERNVNTSCALLMASRSAYYSWSKHRPSAHAQKDDELLRRIQSIHSESRGTYGAPRVHQHRASPGVSSSACQPKSR